MVFSLKPCVILKTRRYEGNSDASLRISEVKHSSDGTVTLSGTNVLVISFLV